jgi:DNA-binding CsgD family transcriptional regulator/DNA polymerase III delta prime subunit
MGAKANAIVGREEELGSLASFVHDVAAGPDRLLLEGPPGVGKTTLWEAGRELARDAGYRVLSARPVEVETTFSYAAVGDLLLDHMDEALDALPPPQRRALEIALLRREADGGPPDQRAVALAVLRALVELSAPSPIVVAVDDVQWLDPSSARVLSFAVRRLGEARVGLLASLRLERGVEDPLNFRGIAGETRVRSLIVGPLAPADLGRIIQERLGRSLPHPLLARVYETSNGNPLFALQLVRALGEAEPAAGEPLPVQDDPRGVLHAQIARISLRTQDTLLLASAMARPTLAALRAAASHPEDVDRAIAEAQQEGVVTVERDRVRFTHPLLASASYWSASDERRRDAHGRLAEASPDLEERARHLALAAQGPDEEAAATVESAAELARARGAPSAAAELYELARDLTPPEEHEDISRRGRLAGMNHYAAGDVARARKTLKELISGLPHGRHRAFALVSLSVVCWNDITRIGGSLRDALAEVEGDSELVGYIHMNLAWVEVLGGDLARAIEHTRVAIPLLADPARLRQALGARSHAQQLLGLNARGSMERAISLQAPLGPAEVGTVHALRGRQVLWASRVDEARALLLEADRALVDQGLELHRHDTLLYLAETESVGGNWTTAERYAEEACDIILDAGYLESRDQVLYARARVASLMGRTEDAERDALEGLTLSQGQGCRFAEVQNRSVLGFLELSRGRHADAVGYLDPVPGILDAMGVREPGAFPCLPDLIEALVATGDLERAEALTWRLHEQGRVLDRALALATAARCRGLLAAARGDTPGALVALGDALEHHARLAMPLELARTLLVRGETLRRMKKKRPARADLERALGIFEELGAPLWAERARTSLARIGGRPARPPELTATERRVAELVARGRTNKEVADEAFLSVKTVEANLRRIYQKLGVRSRTELAHRAARGDLPEEPDPSGQT